MTVRVDEPRHDPPAVADRLGLGHRFEGDPVPDQPDVPDLTVRKHSPTHM
jgi:hypothetical protein